MPAAGSRPGEIQGMYPSGCDVMLRLMVPSGYVKITIENGHLWWIFPLKMVIFHSYVSLPEGNVNVNVINVNVMYWNGCKYDVG